MNKLEFPIDIEENSIGFTEGVYNCLDNDTKNELIKYNLKESNHIFSSFFFKWQFYGIWDDSDPLMKMCSLIINDNKLLDKCIKAKMNLFLPINSNELSIFLKQVMTVFNIDYITLDYDLKFKYLIHSLLNDYLVDLTLSDIRKVFYTFVNIVIRNIKNEK